MIRNEKEYKEMVLRLEGDLKFIEQQREGLEKLGLTGEQLERAIAPSFSFYEQLKEEVEYYKRIKRREFEVELNR
jgi:hypothetical protein